MIDFGMNYFDFDRVDYADGSSNWAVLINVKLDVRSHDL